MRLLLAAMILVAPVFSATGGAGHPRSTTLGLSAAVKLGPNYGETNGSVITNASGVSAFALFNATGSSVAIAFPLGSDTCSTGPAATYTTKEFVIPPNTGYEPVKPVAINKYACLRSKSGASLAGGAIELVVW